MTPDEYRMNREQRGTQTSVAALLRVDPQTISRRERGEIPITHEAGLALLSLPKKRKRRGPQNGGISEACDLFREDYPGNSNPVCMVRRKAAGGLLASLTTKGLGHLDTEYDQFNLTEAGVHAAVAAKGGAS